MAQWKDPAMGKLTEEFPHTTGTIVSLRKAVWHFLLSTWLHAALATGQVLHIHLHLLVYNPVTTDGRQTMTER